MLQQILLLAILSVIGVALVACNLAALRVQRAALDARWDAECEQAWGVPLQAADVLEAAELLLEASLARSPARSTEAGQDAVFRPIDAWVDDTLWHTLDQL